MCVCVYVYVYIYASLGKWELLFMTNICDIPPWWVTTARVEMYTMKLSYFKQYLCEITIFVNNYDLKRN